MSAAASAVETGGIVTEEQYLALERASATKNELFLGRIRAISGGSLRHSAVVNNVQAAFTNALDGRPCVVFNSDVRVHVPRTGSYFYPDVTLTCEKPTVHPKDESSLTNPRLIVEVLSKSTEAYDRIAKFRDYEQIASLQHYLLVSPEERRVEVLSRIQGTSWRRDLFVGDDVLRIPEMNIEIPLASFYKRLEHFNEVPPSPAPPSAVQPV